MCDLSHFYALRRTSIYPASILANHLLSSGRGSYVDRILPKYIRHFSNISSYVKQQKYVHYVGDC